MDHKRRSSNIELLRIIAMLMIVAHHFSVHGGFNYDASIININRIWIQFLQLGGKIGVDIFVLISGYYLVTKKRLNTYKALKLWFQMLFYSIVLFAAGLLLGATVFSKRALLDAFFPVSMGQWWFASTYFVLFLLSPFINIALTTMTKRQYQQLLSVTIIIWSIFPSISGLYPKFSVIAPQLSNLAWFITVYCLGAYIRLWHPQQRHESRYYLRISICCYLATLLSAILFDYLNVMQKRVQFNPTALFDMTSITILIISVTLLLGFLNIDLPYSKVINVIASATFGVYLLHDQESFTRPFLWKTIIRNVEYADSNFLIPYSLAVILLVYLVCTIIELVRIKAIEAPFLKTFSKLSEIIDNYIDRLLSSKIYQRL